MNTTNHAVPSPAGARHIEPYCLDDGTARSFVGIRRHVPARHGNVYVDIGGDQWTDGRIGRYVVLAPLQLPLLSAADARQLARALIAAADEIDWLSDADGSIAL